MMIRSPSFQDHHDNQNTTKDDDAVPEETSRLEASSSSSSSSSDDDDEEPTLPLASHRNQSWQSPLWSPLGRKRRRRRTVHVVATPPPTKHASSPAAAAAGTSSSWLGVSRSQQQRQQSILLVWRILVVTLLLATGALTAIGSYWILLQQQDNTFETSYNLLVENVRTVLTQRMDHIHVALQSLSQALSAHGQWQQQQQQQLQDNLTTDSSVPWVTLPDWELRAGAIRLQTGLKLVVYAPLVPLVVVSDPNGTVPFQNHDWNMYSATMAPEWMATSHSVLWDEPLDQNDTDITPFVFEFSSSSSSRLPLRPATTTWSPPTGNASHPVQWLLPMWQTSPPPYNPQVSINYNLLAEPVVLQSLSLLPSTTTLLVVTPIVLVNHWVHDAIVSSPRQQNNTEPQSLVLTPVWEDQSDESSSSVVGLVLGLLPWNVYLQTALPEGAGTVHAVLRNSCGQDHSYLLNGTKTLYLGEGDHHNRDFDFLETVLDLGNRHDGSSPEWNQTMCQYQLHVYPTQELSDEHHSNLPQVVAGVVAAIFALMAVAFFMYDRTVRRRNQKMVQAAMRSGRIVSSLFPDTVRDRLLAEEEEAERREAQQQQQQHHSHYPFSPYHHHHHHAGIQTRLKKFLADADRGRRKSQPSTVVVDETETEMDQDLYHSQPIADLFPETSVLFADIAGFTAWSSAREPSQVFILLETLFRAFDEIANRRRVFKVETVGDCYVAATGVPEPRTDHAVALARFARDCMVKMSTLTKKLETRLGPDTADLALRMGMHSGPVTAGVLRGERSRFQLFGDTMNTASRMESTGVRGKIQISQDTADLLIGVGKQSWIRPREDLVNAKGKGELRTYWLEVRHGKRKQEIGDCPPTHRTSSAGFGEASSAKNSGSAATFSSDDVTEPEDEEVVSQPPATSKILRLVDWNVEVLLHHLKCIVARRNAYEHVPEESMIPVEDFGRKQDRTILEEVEDRIALPEFDPAVAKMQLPPEETTLDPDAESQLYDYVATISTMYRDNPFHNFEHASHVTMSVSKLLSRIVAPTDLDFQTSAAKNQTLHDHTYGITSDPLTQFACILSALVHDVDHTGVPNSQLVKENEGLASYYKGRSVAEQNSVDVAWDLLFDDCYVDLRRMIYTTNEELQRFRKLMVNSVMATDIMDKELKDSRNARWDLAFSEQTATDDPLATNQRKATIVIEHLIQASDVAHTMQHWHVYRKWNERLFAEMYKAYKMGRSKTNPADFWYQGEIGFFEFYIIPLAKKLKDCGVFGVSSDEYLNYAEHNLKEWKARGKVVVKELVEHVREIYDVNPSVVRSVTARRRSSELSSMSPSY